MNPRGWTHYDHHATAQRLRLLQKMTAPVVEEVFQTYGARSLVGKKAARLTGSGSSLNELMRQMGHVWEVEGHARNGHTNPYAGQDVPREHHQAALIQGAGRGASTSPARG